MDVLILYLARDAASRSAGEFFVFCFLFCFKVLEDIKGGGHA